MIRHLLELPTGEMLFSGAVGENAISGVTVTRCVNAEEELCPGAVCASMLEMSVIAPKSLPLSAGDPVILYTVSDDGTRKQEGIFLAEKPVWERANSYTLTAYDRVSLLDKDLSRWLKDLSGWPYGLLDFANMICGECGLELISTQIPNGDYPVQAFSGEGITGRQLMQWVGQVAGRFCRATPGGQIEFAWYQDTGKVIGTKEEGALSKLLHIVDLKEMKAGIPLTVRSVIDPSLLGHNNVKLFHTGQNILDMQTAGIYHSNYFSQIRHNMTVTQTGIRLDVLQGKNILDKSIWGFCLGTRDSLAGKTITVSANCTRSRTDTYSVPYLGFFAVEHEPLFSPRENISSAYGGYISGSDYKQLSSNKCQDSASVTYTVTGEESQKYIAVLFTFCTPNRGVSTAGDWVQWKNIQVEYGDTPTDYQPYFLHEYTRTFETIYGGNMDWNRGLLTVTHEMISSYSGEIVPDGWMSSTGKLSTGAKVIYPLQVPYTVSLKSEKILSAEGQNRLWTDNERTVAGVRQEYYFQDSLSFEDYQVAPVEKVQIRMTDTDVGAIYPDDSQASNTYILSGNYLLTNGDGEALKAIAQTLYEQMESIAYTPCKVEVPVSAQVDAGDIVTVIDQRNNRRTVYVMSRIRSGQKDRLECTGSPRRDCSFAVNQQSYQTLKGKVLELQTDVEGLRAENRDAQGNLSKLELTVEGIATEVKHHATREENLQEQMTALQQTAQQISLSVQNIWDNGASKVRTQMGYTFDDEGLKISRSNAEMTNLLDNTGMYVRRGEDLVLQANNKGVEAINIVVRNYLTVGENARFENYNDGKSSKRTACFFTGG